MSNLEDIMNENQKEIDFIKKYKALYPDLNKTSIGRSSSGYKSFLAMEDMVDCYVRRSCGCCVDATNYLVPLLQTEFNITIYGKEFDIGYVDEYYNGYHEAPNWRLKVPSKFHLYVEAYIASQEDMWSTEDEDDDDYED